MSNRVTKKCTNCNSSFKIEDYITNINTRDGRDYWCNNCRKSFATDEETLIQYCKENDRGYSKELFKKLLDTTDQKLKKMGKTQEIKNYNKELMRRTINLYFSKMVLPNNNGEIILDDNDNGKPDTKNTRINNKIKSNIKINKEILIELITKWGELPPDELVFLENEWADWCKRYDVSTKAMEILVKEICYQELTIKRKREKKESASKELKDLQDLMGSSSLKPADENAAMSADVNTLGTWIKKFENERPIPEPDPELQDVDGFKKFIRIWFLGHFCKFVGIDNEYSKEYDEEMLKYTIDIEAEKINLSNIRHKDDNDIDNAIKDTIDKVIGSNANEEI